MLAVVVLYYMPKLMTNPRSKVTYSYDVIAWDCYQGTRKNRNYSVKAQCNDKLPFIMMFLPKNIIFFHVFINFTMLYVS